MMAPLNPNATAFVPSSRRISCEPSSPPAEEALTNEQIEDMDKWVQERWNWVSMLEEAESQWTDGVLPTDLYE